MLTAHATFQALKGPLAAVGLSAAVALGLAYAVTPQASAPTVLAVGNPGLVQDEHALAEDYRRQAIAGQRASNDAVLAELAHVRELAAAPAKAVVAQAVQVPKPSRPVQVAAVTMPRVAPLAPTREAAVAAAGPPLALQPEPVTPPRKRPVIEHVRAALATVERIPHWVGSGVVDAADWVVEVPTRTLIRLPERRFL